MTGLGEIALTHLCQLSLPHPSPKRASSGQAKGFPYSKPLAQEDPHSGWQVRQS